MMHQGEKSEVAKKEEAILAFWQKEKIFEKSLAKDAPQGEFTFYDGPPFATGLPHSGSLLSSVSKDLIPRYKTMRGYRVRRRWGWDTHGLPIESLVEKKLGLKNKKEIIALGIEKFNEAARALVLEYVHDWKRYIERVGRWVDFDNSYKTMDNSYIESVWWALKEIYKKGRLYEGRKVLMYCPHCETPLAKAEIAMDNTYKDVTEDAVTIKFELIDHPGTYFLAWTTTPWTLPANSALAVGPDIEYVKVKSGEETLILAKGRLEAVMGGRPYEILETMLGKELAGALYKPLYAVAKIAGYDGKKYEVFVEDFVSAEDGTGIVHTGTIYGEEDYALIQKEGLPAVQLLNPNATYNDDAPEFLRGEYIRKANGHIIEDLRERNLLFKAEPHAHSYPHCYRCGTPLIYNAVSSWFINIQAVKECLLAENQKIDWIPAHLKDGRFGHILESAPDWTISRNRFWASPLPIWKDTAGNVTVIGSLDELTAHTKKSGNQYFVMRHGEAESNAGAFVTSVDEPNPLTSTGRAQVETAVPALKKAGITRIVTSPLLRATETTQIIADALGLSPDQVQEDARLRELSFGEMEHKPFAEFMAYRDAHMHTYDARLPAGESYLDAKQRFGECLYELEASYANEVVLMVTHGVGLETLFAVAVGASADESVRIAFAPKAALASIQPLPFVPLPHNADYELDYHLPYIDRVELVGEKGEKLTRIPEVVDCWVESGSMPFAEYHYPFEHQDEFEKRTPGDFVSEYIGQTRAWFYYLHAMSGELFDHFAFRHVITTGNVLAKDGAKFSKSKGNYTDPYELFDQYGADAFRYYLMSSPVMLAEDITFRDEDVRETQQKVVNMLRNVGAFYSLFKEAAVPASATSEQALDRWVLARLRATARVATDAFDRYDVPHATRPMREFIDDLSTWYVRRSRDRVKGADALDRETALATLRYVLREYAKVIAPVMPFIAEELFQLTRETGDPLSVHLADWPHESLLAQAEHMLGVDGEAALLEQMGRVRALAADAHQLRQKAAIKVRQPLATLRIPDDLSPPLAALLAEEVNVKHVSVGHATLELDTALTSSLVAEGDERELARAVAEARKTEGYQQNDAVEVQRGDGPYVVELSTGTARFALIRTKAQCLTS